MDFRAAQHRARPSVRAKPTRSSILALRPYDAVGTATASIESPLRHLVIKILTRPTHFLNGSHREAGVSLYHARICAAANAIGSNLQDMLPGDWLLTTQGIKRKPRVAFRQLDYTATDITYVTALAGSNYLFPLFRRQERCQLPAGIRARGGCIGIPPLDECVCSRSSNAGNIG